MPLLHNRSGYLRGPLGLTRFGLTSCSAPIRGVSDQHMRHSQHALQLSVWSAVQTSATMKYNKKFAFSATYLLHTNRLL